MRTDINIESFEAKLKEEESRLVGELSKLGTSNPDNPQDWEATQGEDGDQDPADPANIADNIETYENNTAILKQLEAELLEVRHALERIKTGDYGICEVSGEPIEIARLEANPSAKTCIKHK